MMAIMRTKEEAEEEEEAPKLYARSPMP